MLLKNGGKYDLRGNLNFNMFSSLNIELHLLFASEVRNFKLKIFSFNFIWKWFCEKFKKRLCKIYRWMYPNVTETTRRQQQIWKAFVMKWERGRQQRYLWVCNLWSLFVCKWQYVTHNGGRNFTTKNSLIIFSFCCFCFCSCPCS